MVTYGSFNLPEEPTGAADSLRGAKGTVDSLFSKDLSNIIYEYCGPTIIVVITEARNDIALSLFYTAYIYPMDIWNELCSLVPWNEQWRYLQVASHAVHPKNIKFSIISDQDKINAFSTFHGSKLIVNDDALIRIIEKYIPSSKRFYFTQWM